MKSDPVSEGWTSQVPNKESVLDLVTWAEDEYSLDAICGPTPSG